MAKRSETEIKQLMERVYGVRAVVNGRSRTVASVKRLVERIDAMGAWDDLFYDAIMTLFNVIPNRHWPKAAVLELIEAVGRLMPDDDLNEWGVAESFHAVLDEFERSANGAELPIGDVQRELCYTLTPLLRPRRRTAAPRRKRSQTV